MYQHCTDDRARRGNTLAETSSQMFDMLLNSAHMLDSAGRQPKIPKSARHPCAGISSAHLWHFGGRQVCTFGKFSRALSKKAKEDTYVGRATFRQGLDFSSNSNLKAWLDNATRNPMRETCYRNSLRENIRLVVKHH